MSRKPVKPASAPRPADQPRPKSGARRPAPADSSASSRRETPSSSKDADAGKNVIRTPITNKAVKTPTQALGIREAQADKHPADQTRKAHPDSVPLEGAAQPSRRDQVMPTAEPVVPKIDTQSKEERKVSKAKIGH